MMKLDGFRDMDFLDQVTLLGECQSSKHPDTIPALKDLLTDPLGDPAMDSMVRNVLRELLLHHPQALLDGLRDNRYDVVRFCIPLAGESKSRDAVSPLLEMAGQLQIDPDVLHDCLVALGRIGDPRALPLFQKYLDHSDAYIVCACLPQIGAHKDVTSQSKLEGFIDANEAPDQCDQCSVVTWAAIDALIALDTDQALTYLTTKIHHNNPTARRLVQQALVSAGERAVPYLTEALRHSTDSDTKILTANALGFIGARQSANDLINALEHGGLQTTNERFAGYEALGRVQGMKSIVFLQEAMWKETDPMLLLAIVQGLDTLFQPALAKGLSVDVEAKLKQLPEAAEVVLQAVVSAQAGNLFAALFTRPLLGPVLQTKVKQTANSSIIEPLIQALEKFGHTKEAKALQAACGRESAEADTVLPKMLAVDDSGAMRAFYSQFGAKANYQVRTAEHGRAALDLFLAGDRFDVLVVDMNMPVMDGIELTGKLRAIPDCSDMPIIMASTESTKSQARIAKNAGVNTFIVKPFTIEQLQEKVSKLIPRNAM